MNVNPDPGVTSESSLARLTKPPARPRVIAACCHLIDEEVRAKTGLAGIAIKGAYSVVKTVKPKFVGEVVDGMLDDWVARLQPFYDAWQKAGGGKFADYLAERRGEVAEALLTVTDSRAHDAKTARVKKMYEKMRPSAKRHVEDAVPRLGDLLENEAKV